MPRHVASGQQANTTSCEVHFFPYDTCYLILRMAASDILVCVSATERHLLVSWEEWWLVQFARLHISGKHTDCHRSLPQFLC